MPCSVEGESEFIKCAQKSEDLEYQSEYNLDSPKARVELTFEGAKQRLAIEYGPIQDKFDEIFKGYDTNLWLKYVVISSGEYSNPLEYLISLHDPSAISDYGRALYDIVVGMNKIVQDCIQLDSDTKKIFDLEVQIFIKRKFTAIPVSKRKKYLSSWMITYLLSHSYYEKYALSSEKIVEEVNLMICKILPCHRGLRNWTRESIHSIFEALVLVERAGLSEKDTKSLDIYLGFLDLFEEKVEIQDDYAIFIRPSISWLTDTSIEGLVCESMGHMLGIANYCEANGILLNAKKLKAWKELVALKFEDSKAIEFQSSKVDSGAKAQSNSSASDKAASKLSSSKKKVSFKCKLLILVVIIAILSVACALAFFLYKRNQRIVEKSLLFSNDKQNVAQ